MFLSYKDWTCHHEKAMFLRSMQDVRDLLSGTTGTAETGAPYGRCLLKWLVPNLKEVVILRPIDECVESLMAMDFGGMFSFDRVKLTKLMTRGRRALDRIARDPNVLVIDYCDLDKGEACKRLFEFCLPYEFDKDWWEYMRDKNVQVVLKDLFLYRYQNKSAIDDFKSLCKRELFRLARLGEISLGRNC